jgi:glyoxylase-like metal-dependent hydrolase (beta-lactamase superfamily II)
MNRKGTNMDQPIQLDPQRAAPDTDILPAFLPVPGFGVLAANAFVIHAEQPVLVDTGVAALADDFMRALESVIDPAAIRWIWVTHADPDHVGNLAAVHAAAPNARIVTTFLGMAKMGLLGLPLDRAYLLNPGQALDVGDRQLVAVKPPTYDAPETTALFDPATRTLFSADCFGALLAEPADAAAAVPADALRDGMIGWATVDAPWLHGMAPATIDKALGGFRDLAPERVLSSHLPPAEGLLDTMAAHLTAAIDAPAFVGPDQAALEAMMAQAA